MKQENERSLGTQAFWNVDEVGSFSVADRTLACRMVALRGGNNGAGLYQ